MPKGYVKIVLKIKIKFCFHARGMKGWLVFCFLISACNRTYYGDVGTTYELELPKPRSDRMPFLCHLTFTANGHNYGDFVQVRLKLLVFFIPGKIRSIISLLLSPPSSPHPTSSKKNLAEKRIFFKDFPEKAKEGSQKNGRNFFFFFLSKERNKINQLFIALFIFFFFFERTIKFFFISFSLCWKRSVF